jgi:hypothetical protein
MKRIIFCLFFLGAFFELAALAASSPMVERHIFSPEPDGKGTYKSPMEMKMEREFVFTGVIISPQGKWAMIREKESENSEEKTAGLHKEGDEIKGMTIREIGVNYLILSGEGKDVRMELYQGGKTRPPAPAEPQGQARTVVPEAQPKQPSLPFSDDRDGAAAGNPDTRPFSKSPKSASQGGPPSKKDEPSSPPKNPFERSAPVNPFMQETQTNPSNPFPPDQSEPFPEGDEP